MRIGLVQFLNARPLDYGLRQLARTQSKLTLVEDIPSRLVELLLDDKLDAALISSVECLRHKDRLTYIDIVGVCARNRAESLFYIKPITPNTSSDPAAPVERIFADFGSRTTIALLKILYLRNNKILPEIILKDPLEIPDLLGSQDGGLLIGDAAMQFKVSKHSANFSITDLANWWYQKEALPFVFALWAFPRTNPVDSEIFLESYHQGKLHMEEIIASASHLPNPRSYLTQNLHYELGPLEIKSLQRFEKLLKEMPQD